MSFEVGKAGDRFTPELWKMVCCRYRVAGEFAAGKRVLEVGCGTGRGLKYLAGSAARMVGGDYSEENLQHARKQYGSRMDLLLLDARGLPFADGTFDLIMSMEVLQYLPQLDAFLGESRRVLSAEGILVFCMPNPDIPGFVASTESVRHYTVPELVTTCIAGGFSTEVHGAFPIHGQPFWAALRSRTITIAGRVLPRLPGGKSLQAYLGGVVLDRTIVGKAELEDTDIEAADCALTRLPEDIPDHRYQTLYVIARKQQGDRTGGGV